ncbi:MAG: hypothetical protein HYY18_03110 [Planctomycetes bacterium]|nr:hypothetical protein [Planctomycetota bacterium]
MTLPRERRIAGVLLFLASLCASCGKSGDDPAKSAGTSGYGPSENSCDAWEKVMAALATQRASGALPPVPDFGAFLAKDAATSKALDAACAQAGMPKDLFLKMSARMHKGLELKKKAWAKVGNNSGDVSEQVTVTLGEGDPGFDAWVNNNWKRIALFEDQLK